VVYAGSLTENNTYNITFEPENNRIRTLVNRTFEREGVTYDKFITSTNW